MIIGITNLHKNIHALNSENLTVPLLVTSAFTLSLSHNQPTNKVMNIPPSGNNILLAIQSNKLNMFMPLTVYFDHIPMDREDAIQIANNIMLVITTALFLPQFLLSIR